MDPIFVALQGQPPMEPDIFSRVFAFWARTAGTFFGTLIVGGLLLALAPDFTDDVIETVEDELGTSLVWGLGIFVALIVIIIVLVITIIGIFVVIPLAIVAFVLYLVGSAIVFITIGDRLLDAADMSGSRWGDLVVGALVATVVAAIPVIGGLANFVINAIGVGAIVYRWRSK